MSAPAALSPETVTRLSTVIIAGKRLGALHEAYRAFPSAMEPGEAGDLWDSLLEEFRNAWNEPLLASLPLTLDEPTLQHDPLPTAIAMGPAAAVLPLSAHWGIEFDGRSPEAGVTEVFARAREHASPLTMCVLDRLEEMLAFDCQVPELEFESDAERRRWSVLRLARYLDPLLVILGLKADSPFGNRPDPLRRFMSQIRARMSRLAELYGEPELSEKLADLLAAAVDPEGPEVWDEYVQPRIDDFALALEDARVEVRSGASPLTAAEQLFVALAIDTATKLRKDTDAKWQKMLNRVTPAPQVAPMRAVLYIDLEGSTKLQADRGDVQAREVTAALEGLAREAIGQADGRFIKATGDGVLADFGSITNGLIAAMWIQRAITELGDGSHRGRMGLDVGEPILEKDDIHGLCVSTAARAMGQAAPGQILVTGAVRWVAAPRGFLFESLGTRTLRNRGDEELWELTGRDDSVP